MQHSHDVTAAQRSLSPFPRCKYLSSPLQQRFKHCDHCNGDGHTIETCWTLKLHCKYCDRRGHTEERCKFKNDTWTSNNLRGQESRNGSLRKGSYSSANAMESSQSTHAGTDVCGARSP
ncbi:hypothetical protein JRO89_XS15G0090600 [Xanthoceras sorbifolium]|uniref:Uncharacterized protein n=1 Tax=Xanthoceras sorbifolium TaxID=99658 RepID=A0ABQ8H1F1_9ROSI|nr:hypothetical protein JRO89_XS15G0090600 [Xanthoceras sorbifolium]